jgi:hypothetical protein
VYTCKLACHKIQSTPNWYVCSMCLQNTGSMIANMTDQRMEPVHSQYNTAMLSMGIKEGLNGPTARTLAVWIAQRRRSREDHQSVCVACCVSKLQDIVCKHSEICTQLCVLRFLSIACCCGVLTHSQRCPIRFSNFQDLVLHECTRLFRFELLIKSLGDLYEWHRLPLKSHTISPNQLGETTT